MQSTSYDQKKGWQKHVKTQTKAKRQKDPNCQQRLRTIIIDASEDRVNARIDFPKEVLLKADNNSLYKSNYYNSIIEPLNKNIEVKEACTNEDKILELKEITSMIQNYKKLLYFRLKIKFFERLTRNKLLKY